MAPRLTNRSTRKPQSAPPPAREAKSGDNLREVEEAERVQLISFVSRLSTADAAVEEAKVPYDAAKKAKNQLFALAKAADPTWTRKYLERRMEEMNRTGFENADEAAREARHRRWLGILTPEQQKMHLDGDTPAEARDEVDFETEGYKAGLRGLAAKPPEKVPARFVQPWMRGHERGFKSQLEAIAANVPKPKGTSAQAVAEQAAREFKADNPEVDLDKAARKLRNDPKFMERKPEAFEATEEELAAQKPRQALQDESDAL